MTAMWKSSSQRVFQLPWRNSRHHRNALRLVSTSTSSGRLSSLQCSSVSGWTCKAFSVTRRPSDMDGEEETPLINLVFIFFFLLEKEKCNAESGSEGKPCRRLSSVGVASVTQEYLSSFSRTKAIAEDKGLLFSYRFFWFLYYSKCDVSTKLLPVQS